MTMGRAGVRGLARVRAASTSAVLTLECLLALGVLTSLLGVLVTMRPPSGACSRSASAPDILLLLLVGVKGTWESSSDPEILRDLLVGVRGTTESSRDPEILLDLLL